jgi:hypothetical protein
MLLPLLAHPLSGVQRRFDGVSANRAQNCVGNCFIDSKTAE